MNQTDQRDSHSARRGLPRGWREAVSTSTFPSHRQPTPRLEISTSGAQMVPHTIIRPSSSLAASGREHEETADVQGWITNDQRFVWHTYSLSGCGKTFSSLLRSMSSGVRSNLQLTRNCICFDQDRRTACPEAFHLLRRQPCHLRVLPNE